MWLILALTNNASSVCVTGSGSCICMWLNLALTNWDMLSILALTNYALNVTPVQAAVSLMCTWNG